MKTQSSLKSSLIHSKHGFTMVELLVVTTITAVLAGLILGATQGAMKKGDQAQEINAGRTLVQAYNLAAAENNGIFLPGYDRTTSQVEWPDGTEVSGPPANRYPFRLAPYFGYEMEGTILLKRNSKQINTSDTYAVSLYSAFAINYLYVGGDVASNGTVTIPNDAMTRTADFGNIIAFASAGSTNGNEIIEGYSLLTPPRIYAEMWRSGPWKNGERPENFGNIHPRLGNKAAAAFLDGSVRLLTIEELRDMRLWSKRAAELDDPNYTVTSSGGGGRR